MMYVRTTAVTNLPLQVHQAEYIDVAGPHLATDELKTIHPLQYGSLVDGSFSFVRGFT